MDNFNQQEEINRYFRDGGHLLMTTHFKQQIKKRGIRVGEVYQSLKNEVEIIQTIKKGTYEMPGHKPNREDIIVCATRNKKGFCYHIVLVKTGNMYKGITFYRPSANIFDEGFMELIIKQKT